MHAQSISGAGIGLREQHIQQVLDERPDVPWFEILADNYFTQGGLLPDLLSAVRERYPLTFHCIGMSIAGTDALDISYLKKIKQLTDVYQPQWLSDHLCFTQSGSHYYHDLLPFPYTQESLAHVSERVLTIQDYLGRVIAIENVSSYLQFNDSTMDEAEFLAELVQRTDCQLLFDVNNAYVNEINHAITVQSVLERLPLGSICEIHLAGFEEKGKYLIDAHNHRVSHAVWEMYEQLIKQTGAIPTLIEWDNDIPVFEVLMDESQKAQQIINVHARDVA